MLSDTNKKNEADGADLFLPTQILCLFGCKNVSSLKTQLNYIKAFRQEHLLKGEDEYYLTSLESAIDFIRDLQKTDLTLNSHEQMILAAHRH